MKLTLSYTVAVYILQNNIDYKKSPKVGIPKALIDRLDELKNLSSRDGIKLAVGTSKELLDYYCNEKHDWDRALVRASNEGHLDMVRYCKQKGANHWTLALTLASRRGHMDIVKYCEKKMAGTSLYGWNRALAWASRGGHLDIVKYCEKKIVSVDDWDWALIEASTGGHLDIVKYCVGKGAGASLCKKGIGASVCKKGIGASLNSLDQALVEASNRGHLDIVKYCVGKGAGASLSNLNWALRCALEKDHVDVAKYLEEKLDLQNNN